ncbi:hypothetical protein [Alkalicoccobacillus plakortidis]|uniref:Uncharacterized protein n=1 Tax=Alkalicoccobacillus plakortidis TaxID=444060 RepID=A0ABT0XIT4_9BACI|nr:hypothetical protein [Alkalicoccobacillus plakortidis]MCM2675816.1 hypothetical protein [Alkalicoccobacillus plakortidis]
MEGGNWSDGAKAGAMEVGIGAMGPRMERWSTDWSDRSWNWSDGAKAGAIEVEIGAMEPRLER